MKEVEDEFEPVAIVIPRKLLDELHRKSDAAHRVLEKIQKFIIDSVIKNGYSILGDGDGNLLFAIGDIPPQCSFVVRDRRTEEKFLMAVNEDGSMKRLPSDIVYKRMCDFRDESSSSVEYGDDYIAYG